MEAADVYTVLDYAMRALSTRRLEHHEERALLAPEQSRLKDALLRFAAQTVAPYLEGSVRRNLTAHRGIVDFTRIPNTYEERGGVLMAHQRDFIGRLVHEAAPEPTHDMLEARTMLETWRYGRQGAAACTTTEPSSGRWDF